ncbi:hypothetical protein FA15DRAFT_759996 [Coprinopsis marcescibilis]|uniref:Uncharacterized protein n=1 Tax=Coprinopsis marcescibilis TaxID=230819 RepID=A0A5C3KH18_COPMA|nr:hypothetical protein FA15DRAFT_759996 [Coprinopsis marcescibilis]
MPNVSIALLLFSICAPQLTSAFQLGQSSDNLDTRSVSLGRLEELEARVFTNILTQFTRDIDGDELEARYINSDAQELDARSIKRFFGKIGGIHSDEIDTRSIDQLDDILEARFVPLLFGVARKIGKAVLGGRDLDTDSILEARSTELSEFESRALAKALRRGITWANSRRNQFENGPEFLHREFAEAEVEAIVRDMLDKSYLEVREEGLLDELD